jgi:hypothetical protein
MARLPPARHTVHRNHGFLISARETIPPQDLVPPRGSKNLPFPTVTDPAAPPLRPERHVPNSIATLRRRLAVALANRLVGDENRSADPC